MYMYFNNNLQKKYFYTNAKKIDLKCTTIVQVKTGNRQISSCYAQ